MNERNEVNATHNQMKEWMKQTEMNEMKGIDENNKTN